MLSRREFLSSSAGGMVTLLITPLVVGCGTSSSDGTGTSTNPTLPGCDGAGETSTVVEGHSHTLCVPASDLSSPPADGMGYVTSVTEGHDHAVTLTQAELTMVDQGRAVAVTTSVVLGHQHGFTVEKAPAQPTPPPTGPSY